MKIDLQSYLAKKPLYSEVIDFSFFPNFFRRYKDFFPLKKSVHIVGTNGKGSSGRFLSQILLAHGLSVGHYTSPHISSFNERIWINGNNIRDNVLEDLHAELQGILKNDAERLSYFEYTTLLAFTAFKNLDIAVIEAGLGGEFDATNVIDKELLVCTKIGLDHKEFLGEDIESVARTKLNAAQDAILLASQDSPLVYDTAREIAQTKGAKLHLSENMLKQEDMNIIEEIISKNTLPKYQRENLQTAFSAAKILGYSDFKKCEKLFPQEARCQKVNGNITLDVGHNPLAAKALLGEFSQKKLVLVYNSMKDKDYASVIKILKPVIQRVEILPLETDRALKKEILEDFLRDENIPFSDFSTLHRDEEYLVFGSFYVVERFLEIMQGKGVFEK